jgi:ferredoxin-2, mitochondrial
MSRRIQIIARCSGGNNLQMIRSRPKTNARFPSCANKTLHYSSAGTSSIGIQKRWFERRQYYYTTPIAANAENNTKATTDAITDETKQTVPITFIEADGKERLVQAEIGKHLLDVAHDNHVELEGACGGELSCSTCHLIFEPHVYEKLTPKLDDEQDMLDLAFAVTET